MSIRSDLRAQALERDGGCRWPHMCGYNLRLEMAHIIPTGSGGKDELSNVAMLCKPSHDIYDARSSWSQSFDAIMGLYWSWIQVGDLVHGTCYWPGCDEYARRLCGFHDFVLSMEVPVHGRNTAVRVLLSAYLEATR